MIRLIFSYSGKQSNELFEFWLENNLIYEVKGEYRNDFEQHVDEREKFPVFRMSSTLLDGAFDIKYFFAYKNWLEKRKLKFNNNWQEYFLEQPQLNVFEKKWS